MPGTFRPPDPLVISKAAQNYLLPGFINRGIKPALFVRTTNTGAIEGPQDKTFNVINQDDLLEEQLFGIFGKPILSNLVFPPGKYTDLQGREINFSGIRIDEAIMTVTQPKNIIKTPIQGVNGTIKEYISDGDFSIVIDGILIGETLEGQQDSNTNNQDVQAQVLQKEDIGNNYPTRDVKQFVSLMKVPQEITVRSNYLEAIGVDLMVVENWSLPQARGASNYQPFSIRCSSETIINLV